MDVDNAITSKAIAAYKAGASLAKVAEMVGCTRNTLTRRLAAAGVEIRPAKGPARSVLSDAEVARLRELVGFAPESEPEPSLRADPESES